MGKRWNIWLSSDRGGRLAYLNKIGGFSYVKCVNGPGKFSLTLPSSFDRSLISTDYLIEFWLAPTPTAPLVLDFVGMIERPEYPTDRNGNQQVVLKGTCPTGLLSRRIVAYKAGTAGASKADYADDMMKAIVDENLGASAGTGRDLTGLGFHVQADSSSGPYLQENFSYQNVLRVAQRVSQAARGMGNEVFFAVVPVSTTRFEFRTWINQPGNDLARRVFFGYEYRNMENANLIEDHSRVQNWIYSGGRGEEDNRPLLEVGDLASAYESAWNRREGFADARQETVNEAIWTIGRQALSDNRTRRYFDGTLISTRQALYGRDWNVGDRVSVSYLNRLFDVIIRAVQVAVDARGKETIVSKVEEDLEITPYYST